MSEVSPVNLTLRLLRAFVVVSHEGHVGRAAARLYVSQPALSQDIRRLEREIGVILFERGSKGLSLTPAGEELLRSVESALSTLDHGISSAQAIAAGDRTVVRLAYSPSMGNQLMPALLPALEREKLSLIVEESEVDTGDVGPGVISGRYDVGFAHSPSPDQGLLLSQLADERLCVAVAASHRLASATSVRLADLAGSALLIWPRDSAPEYYDLILDICARAGLELPEVKQFRHITPRSYLLDDNQTFSLLPKSTATIQRPEVRFVDLDDEDARVPLMFVRRSDDDRGELSVIENIARQVSRRLMA
ncbi:MAG TPA: LysR family transcriptional regulator [Galbitalea sp.]|jgi:DNA-binding transcriptional LysR family regulator|nr:LysR family transcriptional regulator [Galbitalea sp.]